jgi:hypothetical protein
VAITVQPLSRYRSRRLAKSNRLAGRGRDADLLDNAWRDIGDWTWRHRERNISCGEQKPIRDLFGRGRRASSRGIPDDT